MAALAAFSPALAHEFLNWDDAELLVQNHAYRGLGLAQLRWMFGTVYQSGHYQPLTWLSYALDHALWGMQPGGFHLTSVVLHAVNTLLFYRLALRLLPPGRGQAPSAAFAALFFGVHPLRVESVAWLSERRDVLSGLFYLLALEAYTRDPRRRLRVLACYVLGLLSKVSVVTLPGTLLLLDAAVLGRLPVDPRRWSSDRYRTVVLEKALFLAPALAAVVLAVVGQGLVGGLRVPEEIGIATRVAVAAYGWAFYMIKTLAPLSLQPFYPIHAGFPVASPSFAWALSAGTVIAASVWALRKGFPAASAALASYTVAILPMLGLVAIGEQLAADRYSYLPCLAFALLAGLGLERLAARPRLRPAALLLAAVVSVSLGRSAWAQAALWRDSVTLWSHAVSRDPDNALARNQLASALREAGRPIEEAARHNGEALRLDPANVAARLNRAGYLLSRGEVSEAAGHLEAAIRLNPRQADAYEMLGGARARKGRPNEAIALRRQALALDPRHWRARYNLASSLAAAGRSQEAVELYREAARVDPPNPDVHNNLGLLLAARGDAEGAEAEYRRALRLDPDHAPAHLNWAALHAERGRLALAKRHCAEVLRRQPGHPTASEYLRRLRGARVQ